MYLHVHVHVCMLSIHSRHLVKNYYDCRYTCTIYIHVYTCIYMYMYMGFSNCSHSSILLPFIINLPSLHIYLSCFVLFLLLLPPSLSRLPPYSFLPPPSLLIFSSFSSTSSYSTHSLIILQKYKAK